MRRLDRLVMATFTRLMLLTLMALPPLFMLGDLTDNFDDYVDRPGVGLQEVATGYLYMMPQWIQYSLPIAGLIAAVFTVHGMTVNREVVAAKAGGISFYRLFVPVLVIGMVVTGISFAMTDYVPTTNRRASEVLQNRPANLGNRRDFAFQTESGMLLGARDLNTSVNKLRGVTLTLSADGDTHPDVYIEASEGDWIPDGGWTFQNASVRLIYPDGVEHASFAGAMRVPELTEQPVEMLEVPREPDELTMAQLERQIRISDRAGADSKALQVTAAERYAIPMLTLVIILFGAPLATSSKRGGAAFGIGIALGSTILYLLLARIWGALGTAGFIEPFPAAWMPNFIFLGLGLIFLIRVRT